MNGKNRRKPDVSTVNGFSLGLGALRVRLRAVAARGGVRRRLEPLGSVVQAHVEAFVDPLEAKSTWISHRTPPELGPPVLKRRWRPGALRLPLRGGEPLRGARPAAGAGRRRRPGRGVAEHVAGRGASAAAAQEPGEAGGGDAELRGVAGGGARR